MGEDSVVSKKGDIIIYDSKDIQRIFKCGLKQAYELLHTNGFPSIQIGRKLYVEQKALEKWLLQQQGKQVIKNYY